MIRYIINWRRARHVWLLFCVVRAYKACKRAGMSDNSAWRTAYLVAQSKP